MNGQSTGKEALVELYCALVAPRAPGTGARPAAWGCAYQGSKKHSHTKRQGCYREAAGRRARACGRMGEVAGVRGAREGRVYSALPPPYEALRTTTDFPRSVRSAPPSCKRTTRRRQPPVVFIVLSESRKSRFGVFLRLLIAPRALVEQIKSTWWCQPASPITEPKNLVFFVIVRYFR